MDGEPERVVPMSPRQATEHIRNCARNDEFDIHWTGHAKVQMKERSLFMGDVLYILKNGFIHEEAVPATRVGSFKFKMECKTPNSNNRAVRVVIIPFSGQCAAKVVSVMWVDESLAGS